MSTMRKVGLILLLVDIAFGAGYAFDRWMHRPLVFPVEISCSGTQI